MLEQCELPQKLHIAATFVVNAKMCIAQFLLDFRDFFAQCSRMCFRLVDSVYLLSHDVGLFLPFDPLLLVLGSFMPVKVKLGV